VNTGFAANRHRGSIGIVMSAIKLYYEQLLSAAAEGALILTANKRLARHLVRLYDQRMRSAQRQAWQAPAILSAEAWQTRSVAILDEGWRVLPAAAAQRLWEEIVEADADEAGLGLLQVSASARRAREAHELLVDYRADCSAWPLTDDHRAFLRWRDRFRAACAAGDWLDPAENTDLLTAALLAGRLPVAGKLLLVGFDDLPPSLLQLSTAASRAGCEVRQMPALTAPAGQLRRVAARDASDEVRQAARWARRLIETGEERIGVIAPDLAAYQPLLERIFREELDPQSLLSMSDDECSFNLTLGAPLAQQGPVTAALEILAAGPRLSLEAASFLLRTPYLAAAETEGERRALFELNLRTLRSNAFSLPALGAMALGQEAGGDWHASRSKTMAGIFASLVKARQERERRLPGDWAARFSALLEQVGWPGERPLDSHDFQVLGVWREKLLPQFRALDAVCRPLVRSEAVALLRRMAGEEIFQPKTADSGLQVCGILEAGGLAFDHLWVLGLHEEAWPAPARPNPFLPIPLQSQYGMPHADPAREAAFACRVMERLQAAAPTVIFSHPLQQGGCALRPSPLLADLPLAAVPLAPSHAPHQAIANLILDVESLADSRGPALAEGEAARGGTAILKDQALCPFRAFAHHRLNASALEKPAPGIDPATRGTLVHTVLEKFWQMTGSHSALCALTAEGCRERVRLCVNAAIDSLLQTQGRHLTPALVEIERGRLQRLTEEWLSQVERERTPFTCVECEKIQEESFGGLNFRSKIDRVDVLADGSRLIIDYKTGRVDLDDLLGERLLEPQLPIYGIGEGETHLAAVAFASLRRGECALKGVARDEGILPKTAAFAESKLAGKHGIAGWDELLSGWRRRLEALGNDFATGVATVDPVDAQKACRTCDLATLCRIAEALAPIAGEGEET
jgi:probable DNA repair protein